MSVFFYEEFAPERADEMLCAEIRACVAILAEDGIGIARLGNENIKAPILIVHGKDDPVIPFSESKALAHAIGKHRAVLVRPSALAHVSLGLETIPDIVRVWRGGYWLLAARDRMAAPSFSGFRYRHEPGGSGSG